MMDTKTIKVPKIYYEFFNEVFGNAEEYISTILKERYYFLSHSPEKLQHNFIIEQINTIITNKNDEVKNCNANTIQYFSKEITTKIDETNRQTNDKINELNPKYQNSSVKGSFGEFQVEDFLQERFKYELSIENTSKISNSGDLIVKMNKKNCLTNPSIMIDVKNRSSSNVPKDEQDKFIRDLENKNLRVGILVSMDKGFANKNVLDCEVIDKGKHVVLYVGRLRNDFNTLEISVRLAFLLDEIFNEYAKETTVDEDFERLIEQISKTFSLIQDFEKMKKSLQDAVNVFEKRLKKEFDMLKEICPSDLSRTRKRKNHIDHYFSPKKLNASY